MTQFPDLFAALASPFDPSEVKARNQGGHQVQYVTARTVMNRLDSVLGPESWWDEYVAGENSVLCRLTVRLPDGSVLTKADAGGYAGMPDSGDDDKSGFSDAFKRASVKFGVGRYLYRDGVASFTGQTPAPGAIEAPVKAHDAAPRPTREPGHAPRPSSNGNGNGNGNGKAPTSGRGLFAWVKEQEQRTEVGLLKYLNSWAKLQDFPGRIVDWDGDQVAQAYAEGSRKLESIAPSRGELYEGRN